MFLRSLNKDISKLEAPALLVMLMSKSAKNGPGTKLAPSLSMNLTQFALAVRRYLDAKFPCPTRSG